MLNMKYREKYIDLIDVTLDVLANSPSMSLLTAIYLAEDLLVTPDDKSAYSYGLVFRQWIRKALRSAKGTSRDHEQSEHTLLREFLTAHDLHGVDLDQYRMAWAKHIRARLEAWK